MPGQAQAAAEEQLRSAQELLPVGRKKKFPRKKEFSEGTLSSVGVTETRISDYFSIWRGEKREGKSMFW